MNTRPYTRRDGQRLLNLDASCTYYLVSLANQISTQASNDYRCRFGIGVMEWRCLVFISIEPYSDGDPDRGTLKDGQSPGVESSEKTQSAGLGALCRFSE